MSEQTEENSPETDKNSQSENAFGGFEVDSFLKELSRYYMEFLETNFHKEREPKRKIKLFDRHKNRIATKLSKYSRLNQLALKLLENDFSGKTFKNIKEGKYEIKVNDEQLSKYREILLGLKNKITELKKKIEEAEQEERQTELKEEISKSVNDSLKKIITSIRDSVEAPVSKDRLFNFEYELEEIIREHDEFVGKCINYLEEAPIFDFGKDVYELRKSKDIKDKKEHYFYFFDVEYEGVKYPIFYIQARIEKERSGSGEDVYKFHFGNQVTVNKKALKFVSQRYVQEIGRDRALDIEERFIYRGETEDLQEKLQEKLDKICRFLDLEPIEISNGDPREDKNPFVKVSDSCYVALADKSDEALLNDYEELIELFDEKDDAAKEQFSDTIKEFLLENPESCKEEIREDFSSFPVSKKVVHKNPIPLDQEKQKTLMALEKDETQRVLVQGPPGTGKSHFITAVIYNALLNGESVLMTSDTEEALNVVEEKISRVLDENGVMMEQNDFIHNPILRLGRKNNNFHKIFKQSNYSKIQNRYDSLKRNIREIKRDTSKKFKKAKQHVQNELEAFEGLEVEKLDFFIENQEEIKEKWKDYISFTELQDNFEYFDALLTLYDLGKTDRPKALFEKVDPIFDVGKGVISKNTQEAVSQIENKVKDINEILKEQTSLGINKESFSKLISSIKETGNSIGNRDKFPKSPYLKLKSVISETNDFIENSPDEITALIDNFRVEKVNFDEIAAFLDSLEKSTPLLDRIQKHVEQNFDEGKDLLLSEDITKAKVETLSDYVDKIYEIKEKFPFIPEIPFFIYRKEVEKSNRELSNKFPLLTLEEPHKHVESLEKELNIYKEIKGFFDGQEKEQETTNKEFNFKNLCKLIGGSEIEELTSFFEELKDNFEEAEGYCSEIRYSNLFKDLGEQEELKLEGDTTLEDLRMIYLADKYLNNYLEIKNILENSKLQIKLSELGYEEKEGFNKFLDIELNSKFTQALEEFDSFLEEILERKKQIKEVMEAREELPETFLKLEINKKIGDIFNNKLLQFDRQELLALRKVLECKKHLRESFENYGEHQFNEDRKDLEQALVLRMTYLLDKSVVSFRENNRGDEKDIKRMIRKRKKLPLSTLKRLIKAFPALIVGIREIGEFLPLEPDLFDILIIDEASQVSIAQAFPALLRAKKVIVLGDDEQFSNVKARIADKSLNRVMFNKVREEYDDSIQTLPVAKQDEIEEKVELLDIHTSILNFTDHIANYATNLRKHFRGYPELISYSNENYYEGSLQVMKVRGKPIDEVIKFHTLEVDEDEFHEDEDSNLNINPEEVEFIINKLENLKEQGFEGDIGIISPYRDQVKLISDKIYEHQAAEEFKQDFNLGIWTFDSCQGQQRDIILYSMVASKENDGLSHIFTSGDLGNQRLNVGFSRARERVEFVLSKELEKFHDKIGKALRHFKGQYKEGKKTKTEKAESPQEEKILSFLKQTSFYKQNKDNIKIDLQVELGKYLNQIHNLELPPYRVDFMLHYNPPGKKSNSVIIEYDGFEYHFKDHANEFNFDKAYLQKDIERQKILESFGYDFLRFNKFNLGKNPIETLDKKLYSAFRAQLENDIAEEVREDYEAIEEGELKKCPDCGKLKPKSAFYDPSLKTNYGRKCMDCKKKNRRY